MMELNRPDTETAQSRAGRRQSALLSGKFEHWRLGLPEGISQAAKLEDTPAILAVGGGKGGVGKSILSANLAASIARSGLKVLVLDLDFGCANLHTHFGVAMPKTSLTDFLLKKTHAFRDVILPAPVPNVGFVAGGREEEWGRYLGENQGVLLPLWHSIITARRDLNIDVLILDLGAGTHRHTMEFFLAAHLGVVTILPEATSIENAYVFLKMALWRMVDHIGQSTRQPELAKEVQWALSQAQGSLDQGYLHQLRSLKAAYPEFISYVARAILGRHIGVVVNQTREQADIDIAKSMEHICNRYFGFQTLSLGHLNFDEAVWKSSRNRRLLVADFPHSLIAKRLAKVAADSLRLLKFEGV